MEIHDLPLAKLRRRFDARPIDKAAVRGLMDSIREIGIINPLRVRPMKITEGPAEVDGWQITAGSHRFEAAWNLNLGTAPCIVETEDDLHAELAMIDENLCRSDLTPAQASYQTDRRKAIYETIHPETVNGENQHTRLRQNGEPSNRFTAETAAVTGRGERTIQRDAARGKALGEELKKIEGTSLDKGAEIDALAKLPISERASIIARAQAGERVSARPFKVAADPLEDVEASEKQVARLMDAWNAAASEARQEFLLRIDQPVMDRRLS